VGDKIAKIELSENWKVIQTDEPNAANRRWETTVSRASSFRTDWVFGCDSTPILQSGSCRFCGQTITIPAAEVTPTLSPAPRPPAKGSGAGVTIAAVAVVCVLLCGGVLVALLLPAVQAAREAARRAECTNNLKQIAIAFHNYHDAYNTFPPAYIPDKNGRPMHSWRVLILPFMEEQALYERYNLDEPWDSPGNLAVTNVAIDAYSCPSCPPSGDSLAPTETNYMVITGPETVFDGVKAARFADIKDGTSNTILVVEVVGTGVNWAEPVDLDASNMQFPNVTPDTAWIR